MAFTMEVRLCDEQGVVGHDQYAGRFDGTYLEFMNHLRSMTSLPPYEGAPLACTGSAHLAGERIRCTSPYHLAVKALEEIPPGTPLGVWSP